MPLTFFSYLNRSIFDRSLYRELRHITLGRLLVFVTCLVVLAGFIMGVAHTIAFANTGNGAPYLVSKILHPFSLERGVLKSAIPTPYAPSSVDVDALLNLYFNLPMALSFGDSALVVDTALQSPLWGNSGAMVLLLRDRIAFNARSRIPMAFPFSAITDDTGRVIFTPEAIKDLIHHNAAGFFLAFSVWDGLTMALLLAVSVCFLTIAAFIFRFKSENRFRDAVKMGCLACTPVVVVQVVASVAGTRIIWSWHLGVFMALFVLFRGVGAIISEERARNEPER